MDSKKNVLELLEVFSKQGHSGSSADYVINLFKKLASYEPVALIMCTNDEWNKIDDDMNIYQNNRCNAVYTYNHINPKFLKIIS